MEEQARKPDASGEDITKENITKIAGVRFRSGGKLYNFDAGDLNVKVGDLVIVETENGLVCGRIAGGLQQVSLDYLKKPLKKILRKITDEDLETLHKNQDLEQKARRYCCERILARRMQMKLVDIEYLFDRSKAIFFFTADGRVDFRDLVKDLASRLHTRIEMRQIGVRDEAKMLGGYGTCGKEFCCKTFVREFEPVSIKMAKQQGLTLNPSKISGACGRLMCCLSYENAFYCNFKRGLPKPGKTISTPGGPGKVKSHNAIKGSITIHTKDGASIELFEPELSVLRQGRTLQEVPGTVKEKEAPRPGRTAKQPAKPAPPPRQRAPKPEPKAPAEGDEGQEKQGLISRIKKIAGVEQGPQEKKRRRRRRRGRSRGKGSGSTSNGSEKKKD